MVPSKRTNLRYAKASRKLTGIARRGTEVHTRQPTAQVSHNQSKHSLRAEENILLKDDATETITDEKHFPVVSPFIRC